jgi:methoxymalonate biosynthesis acyl carrier protein
MRSVIRNSQERQADSIVEKNKARIRAFLSQHFQNHDLQDDEDIFANGFVNSLFAMRLVLFVENEFAIKIENEDLKLENFRTINALAHLIERKIASPA